MFIMQFYLVFVNRRTALSISIKSGNFVGEESGALDGPSKTDAKYDEKTGYISVNYEAPSMDISFVQCFKLPSAIDNTSMEVTFLTHYLLSFLSQLITSHANTC